MFIRNTLHGSHQRRHKGDERGPVATGTGQHEEQHMEKGLSGVAEKFLKADSVTRRAE